MPISRDELSSQVAKATGFTKYECREVLDTLLVEIACNLRDGEEVTLRRLGTFKRVRRKGRMGRDKKNGWANLPRAQDHYSVVFIPAIWRLQLNLPRQANANPNN